MYERRLELNRILDVVQDLWLSKHQERRQDFLFYSGTNVGCIPWWEVEKGHRAFTDRRKIYALVASVFQHFYRPKYTDCITFARKYLCYGMSTDETYKMALKCKVYVVENGTVRKYTQAPFALHTMHSLTTGMCVGARFVPNKSGDARAILFAEVLACQAACSDGVMTRYVASDSPSQDKGMLVGVHVKAFEHRPGAGALDVGDDLWHVHDRVARALPKKDPLRGVFKGVLQHGVERVRRVRTTGRHVPIPSTAVNLPRPYDAILHRNQTLVADASHEQQHPDAAAAAAAPKLGVRQQPMTDGDWALVCESKCRHDVQLWLDTHFREGRKVAHQVRLCIKNLHWLFAFVPHVERLLHAGTTSNEHNHWTMNRRGKFTTHMRPDHTLLHIEYGMHLFNRNRALMVSSFPLPSAVQGQLRDLFAQEPGLPMLAVAQRGQVPFILPFSPAVRAYGMQEYHDQFGTD
jgi:hypothetical protein